MLSLTFFLPLAFVFVSGGISYLLVKKGFNKKVSFISQIVSTGVVCLGTFAFSAFNVVKAEEVSKVISGNEISIGFSIGLLAAALALGLSALAAGIAFSSAIPAAIAAMSENEKTFGKSMVFAIIAETIAIYGLLVAILILNKLA